MRSHEAKPKLCYITVQSQLPVGNENKGEFTCNNYLEIQVIGLVCRIFKILLLTVWKIEKPSEAKRFHGEVGSRPESSWKIRLLAKSEI